MKTSRRKVIIIISIILLLGAGGATLYYFQSGGYFSRGAARPVTQAEELYTCSMHPQVMQSEPGQCPICGMDLVPMTNSVENHSGHGEHDKHTGDTERDGGKESAVTIEPLPGSSEDTLLIRVAPAVIQKIGIRTEILKKRKISRELRAVAHVDFNEERVTIINSRVKGWMEKLHARYTGQRIKKGAPLASIYSPELVSTQEEYLQLYRSLQAGDPSEEVRKLLHSARSRLRYWQITDRQIKMIEENDQPIRLLTLYSPYSGVIIEKKIVEGAYVKEGEDLFKIADLSTVWAYVHITEKDIPFVREKMAAQMEVPQLPGKIFKGRVSFIFPYMNEKTRDLKIRVSFDNRRGELRPGMYATLILKRTLPGEHLVAPSSAIIRTGEREIAFVYRGEGVFETREVRTGVLDDQGGIQILEGLKSGEAIVLSGQFLLDSESSIQEAVRKMRRAGVKGARPGGHQH